MGTTEIVITGLISIIGWIVIGFRVMGLCDSSGVSNGWLGFVPFLNYTRWARLAGANPWLVLLWILPIVGFILSLVWLSRISDATASKSPWFWVYLITFVASWVATAIFGGIILGIVVIIITVVAIYSLWMIFDPSKPIARA